MLGFFFVIFKFVLLILLCFRWNFELTLTYIGMYFYWHIAVYVLSCHSSHMHGHTLTHLKDLSFIFNFCFTVFEKPQATFSVNVLPPCSLQGKPYYLFIILFIGSFIHFPAYVSSLSL